MDLKIASVIALHREFSTKYRFRHVKHFFQKLLELGPLTGLPLGILKVDTVIGVSTTSKGIDVFVCLFKMYIQIISLS